MLLISRNFLPTHIRMILFEHCESVYDHEIYRRQLFEYLLSRCLKIISTVLATFYFNVELFKLQNCQFYFCTFIECVSLFFSRLIGSFSSCSDNGE